MRDGAKIKLARNFRKQMTHAEVLLWQGLKGHSREGLPFAGNIPWGLISLILLREVKLIIEVDDQIHERDDRPQRDAKRDLWFAEQGIETMRLSAADIMADAHDVSDGVIRYVREKLRDR